ncbi:hypothetical protein EOPP23_20725 [Endozoicomonas sp. OPT23]|nr:hypothetical protein [Endozoicomonas sp. OPT23]
MEEGVFRTFPLGRSAWFQIVDNRWLTSVMHRLHQIHERFIHTDSHFNKILSITSHRILSKLFFCASSLAIYDRDQSTA